MGQLGFFDAGPGSGLIAEIGMEPAHMARRSSDWAREQIADPALQNLVAGSRIAYLIFASKKARSLQSSQTATTLAAGRYTKLPLESAPPPETRRPRALQTPRPLENRCVRSCPGSAPRQA